METMNFTIQEKNLMKSMMSRKSDSIIANEMGIKISTVKSYKARLCHKLENMEIASEQNIACWKMCE